MAKAPKEEIISRVRIHAETTVADMGPLLVRLTVMGLENIGYELITDVKGFGAKKFETSGTEYMTEYIKEHPTFSISEIIKDFKAQGRSGASAYSAARALVKNGILKNLGPGNYASVDVQHLEGPKGSSPIEASQKKITGEDLIWRHLKKRRSFTVKELTVLFRANGRSPHTVHTALYKLKQERKVRALGDGNYEVLKKPAKKPAAKKVAKKAKPAKRPAVEAVATVPLPVI